MKPAHFGYRRLRSIGETVELLAQHGEEAKIIAGGQSLVPLLSMRMSRPGVVIDINSMQELDYIRAVDGGIAIGACARQATVERSELIADQCSILPVGIRLIGHPAIRNRGTVVGSLVHADPAAELPLLAVLTDARVDAIGPSGQTSYGAAEFFRDILSTELSPFELATQVVFPTVPRSDGVSVFEMARRPGDFASVAVASWVRLGEDERISRARIAVGALLSRPTRVLAAEALLVGASSADATAVERAVEAAHDVVAAQVESSPEREFRLAVLREYLRRSITTAVLDAHGEGADRSAVRSGGLS